MLAALRRCPRRRRARGFTLLEASIVLALLGVLAAAALPGLGRQLERKRLQGAAQELAADLAEARFEAARSGRALFVEARSGAAWCWVVASAAGCDCASAAAAPACRVHAVQAATFRGVRLVEGLAVALEPGGTTAGPAQAAVLETARGEQLQVQVSALGRARVCAGTGAWPGVPAC
jgi:type IV fimbrial biogenesis protein FimT